MASLIKLWKLVKSNLLILCLLPGLAFAETSKPGPISATAYLVADADTGEVLEGKNTNEVRSIASITKVMTALVTVDAGLDLDEQIPVRLQKGFSTKLQQGMILSRGVLMHLALVSSDNLAAKILAQTYPKGEEEFIEAMNSKARSIGMSNTSFTDPTGLYDTNVSTAIDLVKLVNYADKYPILRSYSTTATEIPVTTKKKVNSIPFRSTNNLVEKYKDIVFTKTGWIRKAGGCLVMMIENQTSKRVIVILNSRNTRTRISEGLLLHGMYNNGKSI